MSLGTKDLAASDVSSDVSGTRGLFVCLFVYGFVPLIDNSLKAIESLGTPCIDNSLKRF